MAKGSLTALFLSALYLAALFKSVVPVSDYLWNYSLYSQELCENKEKPDLACNGTCQLATKLKLNTPEPAQPQLIFFEGLAPYMALNVNPLKLQFHWAEFTPQAFTSLKEYCIYLDCLVPPPKFD